MNKIVKFNDKSRIKKTPPIWFSIVIIILSTGGIFVPTLLSMSSNKQIDASFLQKSKAQFSFIFFGYPECHSVCPIGLSTLSKIYSTFHNQYPDKLLDVFFINLTPEFYEGQSSAYAKTYHPNFKGYSLPEKELERIMFSLGVVFSSKGENDIFHTPYIYLLQKIKKHWRLKYIYTQQNPKILKIIKDLESLISVNGGAYHGI